MAAGTTEVAGTCGGHLEVAALGQEAGVRNLVVSLTTEQMDAQGMKERGIRDMPEIYKGNLFFGEHRMEIPLDEPPPARLD